MENKDNKRKWYKPANNSNKKSKFSLEVGLSGFLCTCNFREKECIRDTYRLLEEFDGKFNEPGDEKQDDEVQGNDQAPVEDEDISESLSKEIQELNDEKKSKPLKKFQYLETGAKNVIFISTKISDPLDLGLKIIKDIAETKKQKSRFLLRFIPILVVSKANINDMKAKATVLFEKYFAQEPKTFSIVFNRHYNNTIKRNDVIEEMAAIVMEKNPGNKADLKNPEVAVIVEIIKSWCFLSIAPDYFKYKKYNIYELCNENKEKEGKEPGPDAEGGEANDDAEEQDKESDGQENKVDSGEVDN
ncbi:THUMP domain-containing protein 1 homolog [Microplitis demolitor]|uniref:THUMP domain-containing protein 1 homolog n=1 Tax=Microplitis demolitor TaxID=69319 RepID=UPI0004CCCC5B|nr:THUMP domain-containing protein 1 homolog [Microplitis demolitor]